MSTYGVKLQRSDDLKLPRHPDACDAQDFKQWCARQGKARPLAVDLFSGAGGLSLGLENAGWTVAAAVDHDAKALATHRANFPGLALDVDLGDDRARRALIRQLRDVDIDLVAGGPPCQPFSRAGRSKIRSLVDAGTRDAHDHRKELWRAFVDVVVKIKPRAVLMENVPDMALGDELCVVRTIVGMLEQVGYRTQVRLVDAWRFGVPQHRQRLILLARLDGGDFTWRDEDVDHTDLRQAIGDLPQLGLGTGGREMPYGTAESKYAQEMRRGAPADVVHDHMTRPVRDDDREIFGLMTSKTLYSDIDKSLRRYSAETFDDKYKRLDWADRSRSITAHIAKDGYWYIHPGENRTLTVREAARVQTFPDRFRFAGTRSDAFKQIGNAVPPRLGEAAAQALVPHQLPIPAAERDWKKLRRSLATFATRQLRGENWYLFPSASMTPILAALVAMTRGQLGLDAAFDTLPTHGAISTAHLTALREHWVSTPALRRAADRLDRVLADVEDTTDPDEVAEKVQLRGSEAELYRILLGADRLLPSPTSVRVAARVLGTKSDEANVRTDGRLDLALLVGSGKQAPSRMAAIRLLGSTVCRPRQDREACATCPLVDVCTWQVANPAAALVPPAAPTRSATATTS